MLIGKLHIVIAVLLLAFPGVALGQRGIAAVGSTGFIANAGQWNPSAQYMAAVGGLRLWLTDGGVCYDIVGRDGAGHVVTVAWGGKARASAVHDLPAVHTFIRGDSSYSARSAEQVLLEDVAPGISIRYHTDGAAIKYDVLVSPGIDPADINLCIDGASSVELRDGHLVITTPLGQITENPPVTWQQIGGERRIVRSRFVLRGNLLSFDVGEYNRLYPLIIDPLLIFSSYIGGRGMDAVAGVDRDTAGNIYVVGTTASLDLPTSAGAYRRTPVSSNATSDVFVMKFAPLGTPLLYSTYIGGSSTDEAAAIRVTANGIATIAGTTISNDFPVTLGAWGRVPSGQRDGFVVRLNSSGAALLSATLIGGSDDDYISDLGIGNGGSLYVVGWTRSANFPLSIGAVTPLVRGGEEGFVARFSTALDTLKFSALLGGALDDRALAVAPEPGGGAWVTGWTQSNNFPTTDSAFSVVLAGARDCFITRVRFNGMAVDYSSMFGGSDNDAGFDVAVDNRGNAYVTGSTASANYPVIPASIASPVGSWFATKVVWPPTPLPAYSRYLGVVDNGSGRTIQVDSAGEAYIGGITNSPAFATTPDAVIGSPRGSMDLALLRLSADGHTIRHASVFGGSLGDTMARGSHLTSLGDFFFGGITHSGNLPLRRGAFDSLLNQDGSGGASDGFVMHFTFEPRPLIFAPSRRRLDTLFCDTLRRDTFFIHNVGERDLIISNNFFLLGSSPYRLLQPRSIELPWVVAPGDSIRYVVELSSTSSGPLRDTLVITSNDSLPGRRLLRIPFVSQRAVPALTPIPRDVTLPTLLVCTGERADSVIRIVNSGEGDVSIRNIRLASGGPFSIVSGPGVPVFLREREDARVTIGFRPVLAGVFRDTLVVTFDECPIPMRVPLIGTGSAATFDAVPSDFVLVGLPWCIASIDTSVVLRATGDVSVTVDTLPGSTGITLLDSVPIILTPGVPRVVRVRFMPPLIGGPFAGSLILGAQPCNQTVRIEFRGTRIVRDTLIPSLRALDLGTVLGCEFDSAATRRAPIVLRNAGPGNVVVRSPLISPPFVFNNPPIFPIILAADSSIELVIEYRPSVLGEDTGELLFSYETGGCTDTLRIPLSGRRAMPALSVDTDTLDLPLLEQCRSFYDTTVVLTAGAATSITIDSATVSSGLSVLQRLPRTLPAGGSDTLTIRFSAMQAGLSQGSVVLHSSPCDLVTSIFVRGRKEGIVPVFDIDTLVFGPVATCALPQTLELVAPLYNRGNHPQPAIVLSADIVGNAGFVLAENIVGRKIESGKNLPVSIAFTSELAGESRAQLRVVLGPCGDTLLLELLAKTSDPVLSVSGGNFGATAVGLPVLGRVVLSNAGVIPLKLIDVSRLVAPFRAVNVLPVPPITLLPGDSILLEIEFLPDSPGLFAITGLAEILEPCSLKLPFTLSGEGIDSAEDTLRYCLDERASGLVGDTVSIEIQAMSLPVAVNPQSEITFHIQYQWQRLEFIDAVSVGNPLSRVGGTPVGWLQLRQQGIASIPAGSVRLRFRLLAGRDPNAMVRLDSVTTSGAEQVAPCVEQALVTIADRCVVTGLAFGRFHNRIEPPLPNPISSIASIRWQQMEDARTRIRLFNLNGAEILVLVDQDMVGGSYMVQFSLENIPSGKYLVVLEAGSFRDVRSVMVER